MIECAISRVKFQKKLPGKEERLKKSVAVIGVTQEGVISALDLEKMGYQVYIIDERNALQEKDGNGRSLWDQDIQKTIHSGRIVYIPESKIWGLRGYLGDFQIEFSGQDLAVLGVSAILFAGVAQENVPLKGNLSRSVFNSRTLPGFTSFSPWSTGIPGIFKTTGALGNGQNGTELCGAAAAAQVAALLRKSEIRLKNITAQVDESLCRGCGQCLEVCPFGAIEVVGEDEERRKATIIEIHCQGCGTCLSVCPTGAVDTLYKSDKQIEELIEVMLR